MDTIIITVEAVSTPVVVNVLEQGPEGPPGVGTVTSIFGRTGVVTAQNGDYTASQVGADASGTASSAISTHVALSDPHTQYALKSGLGDAATKNVGTVAGTVAAGDHSHSNATTEAAGFMSAVDKSKLDGINAGANNYTLPTASADTLGGIKLGGGLSIDGNGVVTASGGMTNPMTTAGDIIVGGTSGAPARLAKGSALQVLRMNADASAQEWATSSSGAGQLIVPIVPPNAAVTMTNQGQTLVFLGLDSRYTYKLDLSSYTQCRLTARVATNSASANTPQLRALYKTSTLSTTIGDYSDIGTSSVVCSLTSTGLIDSGWVNLTANAKADVFVTVGQEGGDGAADPVVQLVALHFK